MIQMQDEISYEYLSHPKHLYIRELFRVIYFLWEE